MPNKKKRAKNHSLFRLIFGFLWLILVLPKRLFSKLSEHQKRTVYGIFFILISLFFLLGLLERGGTLGKILMLLSKKLFGKASVFFPLLFFLSGLCCLISQFKKIFPPLFLSFLFILFGSASFFESILPESGGIFGNFFAKLFFKIFGPPLSSILFFGEVFFGSLILSFLFRTQQQSREKKPFFLRRIFSPSLKVKPIYPQDQKPKKEEQKTTPPIPQKIEKIELEYQPPPIDFLEKEKDTAVAGDIVQNMAIIKKTLENFGISVEMGEVSVGPTVTQYTLKPAEGIKLSKITSLANDLSLALAAHPIRIEAPIPGKSLVGIEIPNKVRSFVRLRSLISSPQFQAAPSPLTFALGKDVVGNPVFADLSRMPHLLVAGATGTGKTIFLNSLILSLLYRNSPKILNFVLIDPKRVEFLIYNDLPHLIGNVIFDAQKVVNALKWLIGEMERRFEILAKSKHRDIFSYNQMAFKEKIDPIPYIVLIIDELADLMAARGREIEAGIVRLAQLARAVGIHLVLATQRPSTEVITGLIKANITARVAFQVASQVDSRTILDTAGAEKLLGMGDMLFLSPEIGKPKRIQGAFVSEKEVNKVVEFLASKYKKEKTEDFEVKLEEAGEKIELSEPQFFDEDPLYEEAKRVVIEAKKASASLLQRRLKIGYARAARLLDMLEERGVIGPARGSKPREVYIKEENEWQKI